MGLEGRGPAWGPGIGRRLLHRGLGAPMRELLICVMGCHQHFEMK